MCAWQYRQPAAESNRPISRFCSLVTRPSLPSRAIKTNERPRNCRTPLHGQHTAARIPGLVEESCKFRDFGIVIGASGDEGMTGGRGGGAAGADGAGILCRDADPRSRPAPYWLRPRPRQLSTGGKTLPGFCRDDLAYPAAGMGFGPERFGVRPRELIGLARHSGGPFAASRLQSPGCQLFSCWYLALRYCISIPTRPFACCRRSTLGPGIVVWFFGKAGVHIGASGLVYGLASYIFVAGLSVATGAPLPHRCSSPSCTARWPGECCRSIPRVSWENHLTAALIGVFLAIILRHRNNPPRLRYSWEDEAEGAAEADETDGIDERERVDDSESQTRH